MRFVIAAAATLSVALAGQCTSEDQAFWTSYGQTFSNFLAGCGKQAWGDAKGTTKCLVDDPMNKLTPSCAQCFGDSVQCGRGSCMFSCIAGPATSKCLKCIHNSQCDDKLYDCTGYPASEMPPDPTGTVSKLPVTTAAPTTTTASTTSTTTTTTPSTTTTTTTPSTTTTTTTPSTTTTSTTPSTTTTTTTPSTTTTTTIPSTTTTATTPSTTTTTSSVVTQGSCSAGDHDLWTSYGQAYSNFIAYCGLESFGDAKATTACIEKSGLSDSCSTCFGQSVQCGRDVCMMSCIAGPATEKCLSCIAKTKCNPDLYKCTGYGPNEMPPNPTGTDPLPTSSSAPSTTATTTTVAPTTKSTTTTATTVAPTTKSTTTTRTTVLPTTKSTTTTTTTVASAPSTTTTTTAPSTTTTTTTPSTTTTTTTPSTTTTTTSVVTQGSCSAGDHDLWTSYGQAYSNFIAYCGLESFGDAKATTACIEKSGLSDSCSTCFGQSVQCGRDVCMMSCIAGPATEKCLSCIAKTKCNPDLYKCTGYGPNEMPPNPTGTDPLSTTTSAPSTTTTTTTVAPTTESTTTTTTTVAPTTESTSTTGTIVASTTESTSTTVAPTTESTSTTVAPTTESTSTSSTAVALTTNYASSTSVAPSTRAASTEPVSTTLASTKTTPTQKGDCTQADKICAQSYAGSYCKYWMDEPTCFGSNIPCSCSGKPVSTTTTKSIARCDAECEAGFPGSYCKYWEKPSVCFGSGKPCSC
ncbi:hypothetical protein FOZ62_030560 [Perkinsus olseni]|uniref:Immunoglobulin super DCC subclass member n=2 Tax=Perkinsus olseni TaxID=32597 RepID=A0A7J6QNN3_PEROL|nr:hypothetical protein FOZ62_030560 [Perkinsus olseni]